MLNIGKLAHGGAEYYLATVATSVDDYYTGSGEAPGRWLGREVDLLDLDGRVHAESLRAVLGGRHSTTGEPLLEHPRKVPGFDLTFRAPKSVSLLWALSDGPTSLEVRRAHDAAVAASLDYLERHAAFTRRGKGGAEQVPVAGFVGATFRHRTSRADDPLLHTHVLVANLAHTPDDGRWRTLDARHLYLHAKTAGYLYQAHLRHELTHRLAVRWGPVRNGYADLDGVPRHAIETFSRRRSQIQAELDRLGHSSARAAQVATLATRPAKSAPPEDLHDRWRQRAADIGFGEVDVAALLGRDVAPPPDRTQLGEMAVQLLGPAGLTARASTFDRRDTLQGWCLQLHAGAPIDRVEQLADHLLDGFGGTVRLTGHGTEVADLAHAGIRLRDGRLVTTPEVRYSTPELLAIEQRLVDRAATRRTDTAIVPTTVIDQMLAQRPWLADEQAAAVRQLTTGGDGVAVVVGRAGSGKTSMLGAARQAWEAAGIPVAGVALAARAALELRQGAGIHATTIDRLLLDVQRPAGGLPPAGVLIVDEAGMVGTRTLARLAGLAETSGSKLVLVGDHHQLPEIDAGGAFTGLVHRLPAIELTDNRRQHDRWEVDALDELRDGDIPAAVAAYDRHGRLAVADTVDAVREQLVGDWWQAVAEHGTAALMIAARRVDIDDLNARARVRLDAAGQLGNATVEAAGRGFRVGDRILCLRNHRSVGVLNGTRGTITDLDPHAPTVTFVRDDTGDTVVLPPVYLDAGWVDHGYALTAHKAQGLTCEATFVLADDTTYREWGYVALSRGRSLNRLYLVDDPTDPDPPDDPTHPRVLQTDDRAPDIRLVGELQRSRCQALALDHLPTPDADDADASSHAAEFHPPSYLTGVLGERPTDPAARQVWRHAVATVEAYRREHRITDTEQPLAPRSEDHAAREHHQQALQELIAARRQLIAMTAAEQRQPSHEVGAELA